MSAYTYFGYGSQLEEPQNLHIFTMLVFPFSAKWVKGLNILGPEKKTLGKSKSVSSNSLPWQVSADKGVREGWRESSGSWKRVKVRSILLSFKF